MTELIKVSYDSERPTVLARDLYSELEVGTRFNDWFPRMCGYGFEENEDYIPITQKRVTAQGNETTYKDYQITIDMAKEIAMLQRNEKGKVIRKKLIELEKAWNSPEQVMARALQIADKKIEQLTLVNQQQEQQIAELKPKADYLDKILQSKDCLTVRQIAMDYGMTPQAMNKLLHDLGVQYKQSGQWFLYSKYLSSGYTKSNTFIDKYGYPRMSTKWTQKGRLFLYDLLKAHGVLPVIERDDIDIEQQAA